MKTTDWRNLILRASYLIKSLRVTLLNSAGVEMGTIANPVITESDVWTATSGAATITKAADAAKYYVVGSCDGISDAIATFEAKIGAVTIWKLTGVPASTQVGKMFNTSGASRKVVNEAVTLTCSAGTYSVNISTKLITPP